MASASRLLALAAALATALCWTGSAAGEFRDYLLGPATVVAAVEPDGSLAVTETIEFSFLGTFTGAYRDIPLRKGESIDRISVSDTGPALPTTVYRPGASAKLGGAGAPGTFGVARTKDRVRIVWHFESNSLRTFTIRYRFRGLAVAYDDSGRRASRRSPPRSACPRRAPAGSCCRSVSGAIRRPCGAPSSGSPARPT